MNDFLGKPLAIGDSVVWRGDLTGQPGLRKAVIVKFTAKKVGIEVPNWVWMIEREGPTRIAYVDANLLVKINAG